jgi:NADPH-dependent glutamate synthase beta subunit-like oxidoreductase/CO/xanthine dehydrogenase FAD-binding subunit
MKTFKHYSARSLKQAAALLARHGGKAKVIAGGTDLIGGLKDNCIPDYPEAIINIKGIRGLDYIKAGSRNLKIGALTKLADIVKSPAIRQDYPLLAQATHSIAGPNLRNMATVGGNLAQDVRCWYYRYPQQIGGPITCLRKGGKICNALAGDNRYHSIFGAAPAVERRCASHCPAHIDIPGYLQQIRNQNLPEAARMVMKHNPFPSITGRVCPIFCEPQCNRGEFDDAVSIQAIERRVGDHILQNASDHFAMPAVESGKQVSIIGSGPAGLAAAFYLRKSGHQVTVYDKMPEPGGMLLYSIPPYRLPKEVVRNQIRALKAMGIHFEVGINVGNDLTIARIKSDSDAVFLAGGTWKNLELGVPGEEGVGVHYALDYLAGAIGNTPAPLGNKVIVIGGGSVAIDAARTARRLGVAEAHLICLETRDLTSKDRMPALDHEILEAEEEGIIIHPCMGIWEILRLDGKIAAITTKKCVSVGNADGTFHPTYDEAAVESLQCDSVIIAIGQTNDQSLSAQGIASDQSNFETGIAGVFAGGDMTSGPSTVIQAIASAQKAVEAIEKYLNGGMLPSRENTDELEYAESSHENIARASIAALPAADRLRSIESEDMPGLSLSQIQMEARRCLNCGCLAVSPSDLAIALVALDASVVTGKRTLAAQEFFTAGPASSTVLAPDELIKEIIIPKPAKGARQSYLKFTLRKPLDFAVVSVASVITEKNGVCSNARIALGAVGPAPVRSTAAEEVLKGKVIGEDSAAEAARLAFAKARPLSMNAHKIQIGKTLIKRAILSMPE